MKRIIPIGIIFMGTLITLLLLDYSPNCIIKTTTDERGLTSVQYRQNGQEWGADYLTTQELDSLKEVLNHY